MYCPECGSENRDNSFYCKNCGYQFQNLTKNNSSRICPKCGLINKPESDFCRDCGTKLELKFGNISNKTKNEAKNKSIDLAALLIGFFAGLTILFLILGNLLSYFLVPLIGSFIAAYLAERKSKGGVKIGIYTGALLNIVAALLSETVKPFLTFFGIVGVGTSLLSPSPFNGFFELVFILLILAGSALVGAVIGIFGGLIGNFIGKKIEFDRIIITLNNLIKKVRNNKRFK